MNKIASSILCIRPRDEEDDNIFSLVISRWQVDHDPGEFACVNFLSDIVKSFNMGSVLVFYSIDFSKYPLAEEREAA